MGIVAIEVRRESFYIHADYESWKGEPHPELMIADLDDLISALQDAKRYLSKVETHCPHCGQHTESKK